MIHVLERTPRLEVRQLRDLHTWPEMKAHGAASLDLVTNAGETVRVNLKLTQDRTSMGLRTWLQCPACSSRRRHLYWLGDQLKCRECHRNIRYLIHTIAAGRFKRDIAIPVLKAALAARRMDPQPSRL